jgi:hypothetical protein
MGVAPKGKYSEAERLTLASHSRRDAMFGGGGVDARVLLKRAKEEKEKRKRKRKSRRSGYD